MTKKKTKMQDTLDNIPKSMSIETGMAPIAGALLKGAASSAVSAGISKMLKPNEEETAETVAGRLVSKNSPDLNPANIRQLRTAPDMGSKLQGALKQSQRTEAKGAYADHFVDKRWNADKNKFDYIYPEDLQKEKTKQAQDTMRAAAKGTVPHKMTVKGPAERKFTVKQRELIKGGKADNKGDNQFNKNSIKQGMKIEKEHTNNPKIAKEISKDHLEEHPGYYPALKKMEKNLKKHETADFTDNLNINNLKPSLTSVELADGAPGRTWSWNKHEYSKRVGPKGGYSYDYGKNPQNDYNRKQDFETKKQAPAEVEAIKNMKQMPQDMNSRTLNPGLGIKPPMKKIQGPMPSPQQNQNENKSFTAPAKALPEVPGMGQHQQQQQVENNTFANPVNQYMSEKPMPGNNMAEQAKNAGNVINSQSDMPQNKNPLMGALPGLNKINIQPSIGQDNFDAQDNPDTNPLHPDSIGPLAAQKYGECHNAAQRHAIQTGGKKYTSAGRNAGMHSITVDPDNTVYDFVLDVQGMPLQEYLANVPFSFTPNP